MVVQTYSATLARNTERRRKTMNALGTRVLILSIVILALTMPSALAGYYSRQELVMDPWDCTLNIGCSKIINFEWTKIYEREHHYEYDRSSWVDAPQPQGYWRGQDNEWFDTRKYAGCVGQIMQCLYGEDGEVDRTEYLSRSLIFTPYAGCCVSTCQYVSDSNQCSSGFQARHSCSEYQGCPGYTPPSECNQPQSTLKGLLGLASTSCIGWGYYGGGSYGGGYGGYGYGYGSSRYAFLPAPRVGDVMPPPMWQNPFLVSALIAMLGIGVFIAYAPKRAPA
jgi:hypothetical protein